MKSPFVRIRDCDMLIYWQKPYSNDFTSYTIWAKTQFTRNRFYPFAANISLAKSYLRFTVHDLIQPPFYLKENNRVCFKIAAKNGHGSGNLSQQVCSRERMNPNCYMPKKVKQDSCKNMLPAQPRIERRNKDLVTVTWDK